MMSDVRDVRSTKYGNVRITFCCFHSMLPYFVMFDWSMTTEFAYLQPWSAIVILLAVFQGDLNSWDQGLSCVDDRDSKDITKRCNEYWLNWFWVQCRESVVLWPVWASERTSDKLARKRGKPKSGCDRSLKLWTLQALCLSFFFGVFPISIVTRAIWQGLDPIHMPESGRCNPCSSVKLIKAY